MCMFDGNVQKGCCVILSPIMLQPLPLLPVAKDGVDITSHRRLSSEPLAKSTVHQICSWGIYEHRTHAHTWGPPCQFKCARNVTSNCRTHDSKLRTWKCH